MLVERMWWWWWWSHDVVGFIWVEQWASLEGEGELVASRRMLVFSFSISDSKVAFKNKRRYEVGHASYTISFAP